MHSINLHCDHLWENARLVPMVGGVNMCLNGTIAQADGRILYAGTADGAPAFVARHRTDCCGRLVTPGFIDCHTHLVYAGSRTNEAEARLNGSSYEEIALAGGGIMATVHATRAASEEALIHQSLRRLDALLADGVTTVEIKSGYGLTLPDELKMLRAARKLAELRPVCVRTSFLGAHAVPPEYGSDADGYVAFVCDTMIPAIATAGLADAVDAFCEQMAFSPQQTHRVLTAARAYGLPVKLHAEQLSNQGAAVLAAQFQALSADHLEHLDSAGVAAMAGAGTIAVLLPGAFFHLRETRSPPISDLRAAGVPMAIATDCNPGTSPLTSLLLAMNMAATLFGLTVTECLAGVTMNAARALGLSAEVGTLEAGKRCDLAIWDLDVPADLVCRMGPNALHARVFNGVQT
jgi:imidazolonepropionase